jgi:PEP-CTERM motif
MNIPSFSKLLSVVFIAAAATSQAAVISINFAGDSQGGAYQYTVASSAGVVPASNWINYYNAGGLYGDGLHYDLPTAAGTGSGAYINYVGTANPNDFGSVWGLGVLASNISNPNAGIFNNYLNYFSNGGQIYFGNLGSEFTSGGYNVIVYFSNAYDSTINLTLNDGTNSYERWAVVDAGVPFSGFTESTATTSGAATVANYVTFTGLTSAGFGLYGSGDFADPAIAGIQIVSVPEPSTTVLTIIALGCAVVLFRRRRSVA